MAIDKTIPGVTMVRTRKQASKALRVLSTLSLVSYDVETTGIDPTKESPVGKGRVICFSMYGGKDVDFGDGPLLWVDTDEDSSLLFEFEEILTSKKVLKTAHNFGYDSHQTRNHGIHVKGLGGDTLDMIRLLDPTRKTNKLEHLTADFLDSRKKSMKERFGVPILKKDGTPSKKVYVPDPLELQRSADTFESWVEYSTDDTRLQFRLHHYLARQLSKVQRTRNSTLWDFYQDQWIPLREELVDMEYAGTQVSSDYLAYVQPIAEKEKAEFEGRFRAWASRYCPDALLMNPGSDKQLQTFLFGGSRNRKTKEPLARKRVFNVANIDGYIKPGRKKPNKTRPITIKSLDMTPVEYTKTGWPQVSGAVLDVLAGARLQEKGREVWGLAYEVFGGGKEGASACKALHALAEASRIGTMLSSFIIPLQTKVDKNRRIHTSFKIVDTGRLSSSNPNLQNQASKPKDRYLIRDCFVARKGHLLIVSDYSQLELRILAHMANCRSMIDAFIAGGDFHARTAADMYDYIRKDVEAGRVLLDWDPRDGKPPAPMLKDVYDVERGRGKTINFSLAYGKTVVGFAKQWKMSEAEAQTIVDAWYGGRPEVLAWQLGIIEGAYNTGEVRSLMGRPRAVPQLMSPQRGMRSRGERICKNSPIQGGAADVVNAAMVKLRANDYLRHELGCSLILQVHDELVHEVPAKHAEEAQAIIVEGMENPLSTQLRLPLVVDSHIGPTWYIAKG